MANTYTSETCDTSNPFLKYKIEVTELADTTGYKNFKVEVKAWRTNSGYTTNRDGKCEVAVWDSTESTANKLWPDTSVSTQTWSVGQKPVSQNSNTVMYSDSTVKVATSSIPESGKIYFYAKLTFYASGSAPQYTSSDQYCEAKLSVTQYPTITLEPLNVTETTVSLVYKASELSNEWWYTVLDEYYEETIIPWTKFSTETAMEQTATITGLGGYTTYNIRCDITTVDGGRNCQEHHKPTYKVMTTMDVPNLGTRIALFPKDATDFTNNGLGSLTEATSCQVTEERNGMFELEMQYPVSGQHYNDIDHKSIILAKPNPYDKPQPFRVYAISKPIDGIVTINAEHLSYDLNGYTAGPFSASDPSTALTNMKAASDLSCPFEFWTDKINAPNGGTWKGIATHKPLPIKSILGGNDYSILENYDGEYEYDCYHVKLLASRGVDRGLGSANSVHIRYGKNIMSYKQDENCNNIYTHIHPYWYKEEKKDGVSTYSLVELNGKVMSVMEGLPQYIGISSTELYDGCTTNPITVGEQSKTAIIGNIALYNNLSYKWSYMSDGTEAWMQDEYTRYLCNSVKILPLDLTSEFDDKPTSAELRAATIVYINLHELALPSVTIDVSFVNLYDSAEYEEIKALEVVKLCDTIVVDFPKMNISRDAKCVKTVYNVLSRQYDSVELGTISTFAYTGNMLSDTIASQSKAINNTVDQDQFNNAMANVASL